MQDKDDFVAGLFGCAAILLFIVGWLLVRHGPISWFFFGSLLAALLLYATDEGIKRAAKEREKANPAGKKEPALKERAVSGAVSGAMKFLFNLSIGFGIVMIMQVAFSWWGTGAGATSYGTFEQKFWEWLVRLKQLVGNAYSLGAVATLVLLAIALNSWRPLAAASRARKWIMNVISVLAAALAFSFVTAAPAATNYGVATSGVRAEFLGNLDGLAVIRKEAAAYEWANKVWEKKFEEPEFGRAFDLYLNAAVSRCRTYNRFMEERTAAAIEDFPDPPASVREIQIIGRVRGRLTSTALQRFYPGCEPSELAPLLASDLAVVTPDSGELKGWVPEFGAERRLPPFVAQAEWKRKFDRAGAALQQARDARDAMKGALTRTLGTHLTAELELPADPFVNILKDAALGALAADAEGKIRRWLEASASRDTRLAAASRRALLFAFPDSEFVKSGLFNEEVRNREAIEAMDAVVPDASRHVEQAAKGVEDYREFIRSEEERKAEREAAEKLAEQQLRERQRIADRELREAAERYRRTSGRRR